MPGLKPLQSKAGFTLAEVLIALAILAEIATFTIPKILNAQQDGRNNAIVKETAATFSAAFEQHKLNGRLSTSTTAIDLYQYINYLGISADSSLSIDSVQTATTLVCDAPHPCIKLANGAAVYTGQYSFSGTQTTQAITFVVDPDGRVTDGTTNGPGKSVQFFIYYNGRLTTRGAAATGTYYHPGTYNPDPTVDPPWFSW
ncbi:type II secretion system protein [Vampirovibrio sp.]|uniref:type II secretion system protein n=1 Tax=Vampirovibrio sp. TaxID=2717857 RepID=UPI0035934D7A